MLWDSAGETETSLTSAEWESIGQSGASVSRLRVLRYSDEEQETPTCQ